MICEKCGEHKALHRSYDGMVTAVPPERHQCDLVRLNDYKVSRLTFSERYWRLVKAARETPKDYDPQISSVMVVQGRDATPQPSSWPFVDYNLRQTLRGIQLSADCRMFFLEQRVQDLEGHVHALLQEMSSLRAQVTQPVTQSGEVELFSERSTSERPTSKKRFRDEVEQEL